MNEVYKKMMSKYDTSTREFERNAVYEVNQQIILSGLYDGGFFDKAAFYGGTCLRIFYGLNRFSEDMDFSLLKVDNNFDFESYFDSIRKAFELVGRQISIKKKEKKILDKVESAFLKDNTDVYNISFQTEKAIKIKIEVDTNPPMNFETEQKLLFQPKSFMTRCFTVPDLFAGKMHALVFRAWADRIKGRDWYDFAWYVINGYPLHYNHLKERIRQFNGVDMNKDEFHQKLIKRLATADIELVKKDVFSFIKDPKELDLWSNDYFLKLAEMIDYQ